MWTLQGFFSGSDDTKDYLDILFGIFCIVILLNVVIAIVGDAWELATDTASSMYWSFRVSYLVESRIFAIIQKNFMNGGMMNKLSNAIDGVKDIAVTDHVTWSKGVYSQVTSKAQYDQPDQYFDEDTAAKILQAHSLQADLYWVQVESKNQKHIKKKEKGGLTSEEKKMEASRTRASTGIMRVGVVFTFFMRCLLYIVLIALGIVTGGWFWPVSFRRGVLSLGLSVNEKDTEDKVVGDEPGMEVETDGSDTENNGREDTNTEEDIRDSLAISYSLL